MSEQHNETAKVALVDQRPAGNVQAQSPLHHVELETLAQQGPKTGGIQFRELKFMGLLNLRCNPDQTDQLATVEKVLGVGLPLEPLTSVENGDYSIRWIAPDEWLIVVPGEKTFEVETLFREQMSGHYSLVNSSGGSTVFELSGDFVVEMLKKCTPIDLHLSQFPVGKVVSTVFAKSQAVIRRTGEARFELIVRRTFADYIWLWIQDASREFGLVIEH